MHTFQGPNSPHPATFSGSVSNHFQLHIAERWITGKTPENPFKHLPASPVTGLFPSTPDNSISLGNLPSLCASVPDTDHIAERCCQTKARSPEEPRLSLVLQLWNETVIDFLLLFCFVDARGAK